MLMTLTVFSPLLPVDAAATPGPGNLNIAITGTVQATATCTFSGPDPIQVEFGDVYINEIAEGIYKQQILYQLNCSGDPEGKKLQMQLTGTAASDDSSLLKTSADGLSVKLIKGNDAVTMNQWFNIDAGQLPSLYAELIKQSGARFQNGEEFTASATLKVAYN